MCAEEAYPRKTGSHPLQATFVIRKGVDRLLSLELAHNLPHPLCQGWYSSVIMDLCMRTSGFMVILEAAGQGFSLLTVCKSQVFVHANRPVTWESSKGVSRGPFPPAPNS